jgi:dUTP pyrophosphatase
MVKVTFQKLHPDAVIPSYATRGSAGMDLSAVTPIVIEPSSFVSIPIGLAIEIPEGWEGQIRPRSGHASLHGITVLNSPGTIDCDFRGEINVLLINLGQAAFHISPGMRIAQLIIAAAPQVEIEVASVLSGTIRGHRGFGSTGSK